MRASQILSDRWWRSARGRHIRRQGRAFRGRLPRWAILLVSLILVMIAIPVAAHSYESCNSSEFCVFAHRHGYLEHVGGDWHDPSTSDPDWPMWGHHGVQNDDQAFISNEALAVRVYNGNSYTGAVQYCAKPGTTDPDIPFSVDNAGNSHKVYGSTSCPAGDVALP